MSSTIKTTQRLDRLSIAGNASLVPAANLNDASASNGPSLPPSNVNQPIVFASAAGQSQLQTATTNFFSSFQGSSDDDVDMTNIITAGTANLSIRGNPVQNPQPLDSHLHQNSEQRPPNNSDHQSVISMAAARTSTSARAPTLQAHHRPRPLTRTHPSRLQGREEPSRLFRQRAQIHREARLQRRRNGFGEASRAGELHQRNLLRAQLRYAQLMVVSAMATERGH